MKSNVTLFSTTAIPVRLFGAGVKTGDELLSQIRSQV